MEIMIAFVVAWVARRVVEDKTDEFEYSNAAVRDRINDRYPNLPEGRRARMVRNAARRNAAGFGAYQLRHGWPEFRYSVAEGWREARRSHEEWLKNQDSTTGEGKTGPSGWLARVKDAVRSGWDGARKAASLRRTKEAEAKKAHPAPVPVPANTENSDKKVAGEKNWPGKITITSTRNAETIPPTPPAIPTTTGNGGQFMAETGETSGYGSAKQYAENSQSRVAEALNALEQAEASLIAGGFGSDQAVMTALAAARDGLSSAQGGFANLLTALNSHQQGAEYASSKGDAAAKTEFLRAE